jgi:hypothetical protein
MMGLISGLLMMILIFMASIDDIKTSLETTDYTPVQNSCFVQDVSGTNVGTVMSEVIIADVEGVGCASDPIDAMSSLDVSHRIYSSV